MSRRHTAYLALVLTGLLLAIVACVAAPSPKMTPDPSAVATSTVAPATNPPALPIPEDAGVAVLEQYAGSSDLRLLPVAAKPLAYGSFDLFSGEVPDDTESQIVLALVESADSSGTHLLYSVLPVTNATVWHEYGWFAAADGSAGSQIALGPGLPISRTISELGSNEGTLGDSYRRLDQAGWDSSRARRLLLRDAEGQYQLILLGCLPGDECDGSPAPGDSFCDWCDRCSSGWCMWCKKYCQ
jgi:hypothetical protein